MKKYFLIVSISLLSILLYHHFEESPEISAPQNSFNPHNEVQALIKKEKKEKKERMRMGYPNKHAEIQLSLIHI